MGFRQIPEIIYATLAQLASYATLAQLASTANGDGASLIGIEDSAGNFTATDVEGALAEANDSTQGKHSFWIDARDMIPATTNGPASNKLETAANRVNYSFLDFDGTTEESAHFQRAMPKGWNEGTITYQVYWSSNGSDTDSVVWALQAVALSDGEARDVAFGTAVTVTDALQSTANEVFVSDESADVTIAGTPAEGDLCLFRFYRAAADGSDTMAEDGRLIGIKIFYTTDANTDD